MVDSNFASIITPIKMVVKSASLAVNIEQFWPFLTSSYLIYEQSFHLCSASQMMVLALVVAAMEKKSERKLLKRKVGHWCKRKENIYTLEANIQQILIHQRWLKKQQMLLIFKQPALRRASLPVGEVKVPFSSNLLLKSFPACQLLSFSMMFRQFLDLKGHFFKTLPLVINRKN